MNRLKSAVAHVSERKFLGHRLLSGGRLGIAPHSIKCARERLGRITARNRGVSFGEVIGEVNQFVRGWVAYFRYAACKTHLNELDEWLRHKLRCVRLKQCNRRYAIAKMLIGAGVPANRAWLTALSGKGWWRRSQTPPMQEGLSLQWFRNQGITDLLEQYVRLKR